MMLALHTEFKGQAENETVLFATRAHWLALIGRIILNAFAWGLTGLVIAIVLDITVVGADGISLNNIYHTPWLMSMWMAAIVSGILYAFTMWYLYLLVITDQRIIEFVQRGPFSSYTLDFKFENIKDSAYAYRNPLHYLFNFGSLIVRSAPSAIKRFEADSIPNPRDIHHYINKLIALIDQAKQKGEQPVLPVFKKKWGKRHLKRELIEEQRRMNEEEEKR